MIAFLLFIILAQSEFTILHKIENRWIVCDLVIENHNTRCLFPLNTTIIGDHLQVLSLYTNKNNLYSAVTVYNTENSMSLIFLFDKNWNTINVQEAKSIYSVAVDNNKNLLGLIEYNYDEYILININEMELIQNLTKNLHPSVTAFDYYNDFYYINGILDSFELSVIDINSKELITLPSKSLYKIEYNPVKRLLYGIVWNLTPPYQLITIDNDGTITLIADINDYFFHNCGWNKDYSQLICTAYQVSYDPHKGSKIMIYDLSTNSFQYMTTLYAIDGIS